MTFMDYNASFYSVLPAMRARDEIIAEINSAASGQATDISRSKIAQIELHISNGDSFYRQRSFSKALDEFKTAKAMIFQILHPVFDIGAYIRRKDIMLPYSVDVEKSLMNASLKVVGSIRPIDVKPIPIFQLDDDAPEPLKPYFLTGFREEGRLEEPLQMAAKQSIAFMKENKPEMAVLLLEDAISHAASAGAEVDPTVTASLKLNLASAYLQSGKPDKAQSMAAASLENFKSGQNIIGQAQAIHLSGVSAQQAGDTGKAQEFFKQASELLKKKPSVSSGRILRNIEISSLRSTEVLKPIVDMDVKTLTVRIPGREDNFDTIAIPDDTQKREQGKKWQIGIPVGKSIVSLNISSGSFPSVEEVIAKVYQPRISAKFFADIDWEIIDTSTTSFYLTHLYAYVLPVKIGDSYHELGQYGKAEEYYTQASKYSYINQQVEATALWIRFAHNAVVWGNTLYKNENLADAKVQYSKIITENGTVPDSVLYTSPSLAVPANDAKIFIQNILQRPLPEINWEIASVILTASSLIQQILQGLDYYGLMLSPIHTFEYLQSVARGFAQEAVQAEREFENFKSREEMEEATRRDLEAAKAMADAEANARYAQYLSSVADEAAAKKAWELATQRYIDAIDQKNQYSASSWTQIWAQAAATALGGGSDALFGEISELADKLDRGEKISGEGPKLAAAQTFRAGRKTRDYELQKMQDNIDELNSAIGIALAQWNGAIARTSASEIAWQAAVQKANMAGAALIAFDNEFFTPAAWSKMADVMRDISRNYLYRAIRIAKLMERAYNFENDTEIKIIKNDYGHKVANPASGGDIYLLGGDSLIQDIEAFTYTAITNKTRKISRIKDIISIASDFPAQFEEFRSSGLLSFETDLYEFDRLHPGFYGQRIEAVEVGIIGLLPEMGLKGTLTAGGVTSFRRKDSTVGTRVHQVDTMALSEFVMRNDVFLYSAETGVRGLFQGLGIGSTWQLHLPKRSNDMDYRRIFDVHLVLYYTASFDPLLRTHVLSLPPRPGELDLLRNFSIRYDFPDAWYAFYRDGAARFTLDRVRLPTNQKNFKIKSMQFRVITKPGVSNQDITVRITAPRGSSGTEKTDSNGVISTDSPQLAAIVGSDPIGAWRVEITEGASITEGTALKLDRVHNIQIGLEYTFEYVEEAI